VQRRSQPRRRVATHRLNQLEVIEREQLVDPRPHHVEVPGEAVEQPRPREVTVARLGHPDAASAHDDESSPDPRCRRPSALSTFSAATTSRC